MNILKNWADNTNQNSLANKFRKKRFNLFLNIIKDIPGPISILDVGGTIEFWKQMDFLNKPGITITILNLEIPGGAYPGINFVLGDARNLSMFKDKQFDLVFSNSVIEHVGGYDEQKRMAEGDRNTLSQSALLLF